MFPCNTEERKTKMGTPQIFSTCMLWIFKRRRINMPFIIMCSYTDKVVHTIWFSLEHYIKTHGYTQVSNIESHLGLNS